MNRPLLFLGVDGPLNPYAAKPHRRPDGYTTLRVPPADGAHEEDRGFSSRRRPLRVWLNPEHGRFLLRLGFELCWATTRPVPFWVFTAIAALGAVSAVVRLQHMWNTHQRRALPTRTRFLGLLLALYGVYVVSRVINGMAEQNAGTARRPCGGIPPPPLSCHLSGRHAHPGQQHAVAAQPPRHVVEQRLRALGVLPRPAVRQRPARPVRLRALAARAREHGAPPRGGRHPDGLRTHRTVLLPSFGTA
ncbi:hypothetical protein SUDANB126_00028 [Streptomyces sp. enrichment culture]